MLETKAIGCREVRSEIFLHARQTKLLIWGQVSRGRCEQSDGQLALRSDGTGTWSCVTTSSNGSDGDVWHADFAVKDSGGVTLFGVGPFYSPLLSTVDSRRESRWWASFTFQAELFLAIHAAVQHCGCLPPAHALRQAARQDVTADAGWCRKAMMSAMEGSYA